MLKSRTPEALLSLTLRTSDEHSLITNIRSSQSGYIRVQSEKLFDANREDMRAGG